VHPPFEKRIFLVARAEIGYLRFIVESYEGLVFLRTLDPRQALVEVSYPEEREDEANGLLTALAEETGWQDVTDTIEEQFPPL
jgi:hypothetical protein